MKLATELTQHNFLCGTKVNELLLIDLDQVSILGLFERI
jgi:hypothetical protein